MNPCPECHQAEQDISWAGTVYGCFDCDARSLASVEMLRDVALADAIVPAYRNALQQIAGERAEELHQRVKYWAAKLEAAK